MRLEHDRRAFVLLAVLWVMVGASAVGLGLALEARHAALAAHNRRALIVARWAAEDCLNRSEAIVDDALHRAASAPADSVVWATLDKLSPYAPDDTTFVADTTCDATLRPAGTTIDVNTADDTTLTRLFVAAGFPVAQADSLADAILDWRDPDQVPRPLGAEAEWYRAHNRMPPRDGPFADARELYRVRGLEHVAGLDSLLGVDSDRVVIDRAPFAVVAALPGITDEAIARIAEVRARGAGVGGLIAFGSVLSPNAKATLLASYAQLARVTATEPDAWILVARGWSGVPHVTADVEVRLVRAGARAAIVRRRAWTE